MPGLLPIQKSMTSKTPQKALAPKAAPRCGL